MAFKVSPSQRLNPPKPPRSREEIFNRAARAAVYWLLAQGAFFLLLNLALAMWTRARYSPESFPLVKALGLAQLVLGYYLYHALKEPFKQKLLTDALLLYYVGSLVVTVLSFRYSSVNMLERLIFLVNLGFCFVLFKYRPEGFRVILAALAWIPGLKKFASPPEAPKEAAPAVGKDSPQ